MTEDELLIQDAKNGNLEAFNQLVLRYQDQVYHQALWMVNDPEEAEDMVQEAFIKAYQNLTTFHGGSFRAWLLRIVTNTSCDALRRRKRFQLLSLIQADEEGEENDNTKYLVDPGQAVEEEVAMTELSARVYRLVAALPKTYREPLILVDIQELDYAEAATVLRVPIGTLKSRLVRARLKMREQLFRIQALC